MHWPLTFPYHTTSRISQDHSLHQYWTLWDQSFLNYCVNKQTQRQTRMNVLLPRLSSAWVIKIGKTYLLSRDHMYYTIIREVLYEDCTKVWTYDKELTHTRSYIRILYPYRYWVPLLYEHERILGLRMEIVPFTPNLFIYIINCQIFTAINLLSTEINFLYNNIKLRTGTIRPTYRVPGMFRRVLSIDVRHTWAAKSVVMNNSRWWCRC